MNEHEMLFIRQKLIHIPAGMEFGIAELFGSEWDAIPHKQSFGRKFKQAVNQEYIQGVRWSRLENSPRHDRYVREGER